MELWPLVIIMVTPDLDTLVIPVVGARAQAAASVFGFLLLHHRAQVWQLISYTERHPARAAWVNILSTFTSQILKNGIFLLKIMHEDKMLPLDPPRDRGCSESPARSGRATVSILASVVSWNKKHLVWFKSNEIVICTSISLLLGSSLNSNVVVTAAVAVGSDWAKEGRSTAVMLLTRRGSRMKSWPETQGGHYH